MSLSVRPEEVGKVLSFRRNDYISTSMTDDINARKMDIYEKKGEPGKYEATLTICSVSANGSSSEIFYTGRVLYSDMLIRFSFVNQYNPLEEDLLYIFNPLELRDFTMGLLCGISSADLMPCAFKCVVTLKPQEHTENFRHQLLFTKKDLKRLEQLNMLLVDNK